MKTTLRAVAAAVSVLTIACASMACGGFSTQEATARCDQEQEARGTQGCFTALAYDECRVAYEECGDDVDVIEECPVSYVCPD